MNIIELGIIIIGVIFVVKYIDYRKMLKEYEVYKEAMDKSVEIYSERMEKIIRELMDK